MNNLYKFPGLFNRVNLSKNRWFKYLNNKENQKQIKDMDLIEKILSGNTFTLTTVDKTFYDKFTIDSVKVEELDDSVYNHIKDWIKRTSTQNEMLVAGEDVYTEIPNVGTFKNLKFITDAIVDESDEIVINLSCDTFKPVPATKVSNDEKGISMEQYMDLFDQKRTNYINAEKLRGKILEHFQRDYCVKVGHPTSSDDKVSTDCKYYTVSPKNGGNGRGDISDLDWVKLFLKEINEEYTSELCTVVIETSNEFIKSLIKTPMEYFSESIDDKNKRFKIGQKIKVLSGIEPLITTVKDIKWDERNERFFYYFDDENGKEWHEDESAIEEVN